MRKSLQRCFFCWLTVFIVATVCLWAKEPTEHLNAVGVVGSGWYPWYEVHADPEDSRNLIVCGTKWDATKNEPLGFVQISTDGGLSWRPALEDRSTSWVTEQSCAFGPKHRAYFISEASRVVDGKANHRRGLTRLFVSTDAGSHWTESLRTGWADHSTSAVDSKHGSLHTFYNSPTTIEPGNHWGSNIGLLVFSPEGKSVHGPFLNPRMQALGYEGVYPSAALATKDGAIVALYLGLLPEGRGADLGVIRTDAAASPSLDFAVIAQIAVSQTCPYFNKGSLAYDSERNRLFAIYGDGCSGRALMLTSSDDGGRNWSKGLAVMPPPGVAHTIVNPSLFVDSQHALWILWEDDHGTGTWFLSSIEENRLVELPLELTRSSSTYQVRSDALFTQISQLDEYEPEDQEVPTQPSVILNVLNMRNNVWRSTGLLQSNGKLVAVWPSANNDGMELDSGVLEHMRSAQRMSSGDKDNMPDSRATKPVVVLYGGSQRFDAETSILQVCLKLGNRGSEPLRVPIKLEATTIKSAIGSISVANAVNGQQGIGAMWDISQSVTGDRIPPRATSNPFCLDFRLRVRPDAKYELGTDILSLGIKVQPADADPIVGPMPIEP